MANKYKLKVYVAELIGKEHIIPLLGVYNNLNQIDFDKLPNIKTTHDSGGNAICKDKNNLDIVKVRDKINNSIKT